MCHNRHDPHPPLHNTSRHLIVFYIFLSIHILYISPCTHQTDNIIMSILRKTTGASNPGKRNERQSKHATTVWLQSSHGKHVEQRIFRERGISDATSRSRHQKKALCFQTEYPVQEHPAWGQECQQSVGGSGGGHYREKCAT